MITKVASIITFALMVSIPVFSQNTSNDVKQRLNDHYNKTYEYAIKYNDLQVAREALYNLLALNPQRTGIKDTLAYLYYNSGSYVQVILIGREILEADPKKADILELVAVSQQNLGLLKEALESFEKLYAISRDIYHQYNLASLQYMLKRFGECSENLNAIISSPDTSGMKVTISDSKGESQQVPIKAAAFNMRGVIALEINQRDVAKQNFEKALELFPGFVLAQANLKNVAAQGEKIEEQNKTQEQTPEQKTTEEQTIPADKKKKKD